MTRGILVAASILFIAGCGNSTGLPPPASGSGATASHAIKVLSNRADLVSGDDVLVEIALPAQADTSALRVDLGGRDVTSAFTRGADGRLVGLVTGLALGRNVLAAHGGGVDEQIEIVNHPNGGPVFSGPQLQPWQCLEADVLDAQCNKPAEYTYLYKSTRRTKPGLQPYDPDHPAADVATTTTDEGVTLPFVVRKERGWQDRDEYVILTLFHPGQDWSPAAPQEQWNRKLVITHGGGCGNDFGGWVAKLDDYSGTIPSNPAFEQSYIVALGRGFAVLSTALNNNGHDCNLVLQAESLMMAKERFVEQYGELRYTIGTGCSGGSLAQQQISNAYPGIYQGLLTTCSYPDTLSAGAQFADYHLLRLYFNDLPEDCSPIATSGCSPDDITWVLRQGTPTDRGVIWTLPQMAEVEGHLSHVNAITADDGLFKGATSPTSGCWPLPVEVRYDPQANPSGVRCGLFDHMINVLGPRPRQAWSPMEQAAGRGFAGSYFDNVGIQYGLKALQQGLITPAQFVDLNVHIGGLDIDIKPMAQRSAADRTSLANAYRSGAINEANHLDGVAIINFTGPDPGAAHDSVHTFWTRWRLDREHGNHDNQVIWEGPVALVGDPNYVYQGLTAMDRWLSAIEQDRRALPIEQKIVEDKPADIHDQCSDGAGDKIADGLCPDAVVAVYGTPRTVAGDVDTADNMKCELKPLNRDDDYGLLPFTDAQWAQLQEVFVDGVCDYSQPGVDRQGATIWLTYQDELGNVIYGGAPLPAATLPAGWASPAFSGQ